MESSVFILYPVTRLPPTLLRVGRVLSALLSGRALLPYKYIGALKVRLGEEKEEEKRLGTSTRLDYQICPVSCNIALLVLQQPGLKRNLGSWQ